MHIYIYIYIYIYHCQLFHRSADVSNFLVRIDKFLLGYKYITVKQRKTKFV